jgi:hypothetical protein
MTTTTMKQRMAAAAVVLALATGFPLRADSGNPMKFKLMEAKPVAGPGGAISVTLEIEPMQTKATRLEATAVFRNDGDTPVEIFDPTVTTTLSLMTEAGWPIQLPPSKAAVDLRINEPGRVEEGNRPNVRLAPGEELRVPLAVVEIYPRERGQSPGDARVPVLLPAGRYQVQLNTVIGIPADGTPVLRALQSPAVAVTFGR